MFDNLYTHFFNFIHIYLCIGALQRIGILL